MQHEKGEYKMYSWWFASIVKPICFCINYKCMFDAEIFFYNSIVSTNGEGIVDPFEQIARRKNLFLVFIMG